MVKSDAGREAGLAALELLLVLPVLAGIMLSLVWGIKAASRNYLELRARAEVRQEVQQAFIRVVDDCLGATAISRGNTVESIRIYDGELAVKEYFVNEDKNHVRKLVENRANLPMTGNHAWAMVEVTSFGVKAVDATGRPGLYRIWLAARSTRAAREIYSLATEIYLPPQNSGGRP